MLIDRKILTMCHVLVIEDEPLIAEYVGALAEMAGATSFTIADTVGGAVTPPMPMLPT